MMFACAVKEVESSSRWTICIIIPVKESSIPNQLLDLTSLTKATNGSNTRITPGVIQQRVEDPLL